MGVLMLEGPGEEVQGEAFEEALTLEGPGMVGGGALEGTSAEEELEVGVGCLGEDEYWVGVHEHLQQQNIKLKTK